MSRPGMAKADKPTAIKKNHPKSVIITDEDIYYFQNNKNSLTKTVYEQLILMFMTNKLIPGQMLNRRQLADDLGVSVGPVLEALVQLEVDGYIESIPRKGTIVRPIREQDVYERFVVRECIECGAARLYAGLPIRQNKDELLVFAKKIDTDELHSISQMKDDILFHTSLVNLAGIPSLTREYLRVMRVGTFYIINRESFFKGVKYQNHVDLIKRLTTDDPDEAEKIIREHVWSGKLEASKYRSFPGLTGE